MVQGSGCEVARWISDAHHPVFEHRTL